jgi:hypothetical protein
MCEQCRQLLEEFRAANDELYAITRDLADLARGRETDEYDKLWLRRLEFSQKSQDARFLLLEHLHSHSMYRAS